MTGNCLLLNLIPLEYPTCLAQKFKAKFLKRWWSHSHCASFQFWLANLTQGLQTDICSNGIQPRWTMNLTPLSLNPSWSSRVWISRKCRVPQTQPRQPSVWTGGAAERIYQQRRRWSKIRRSGWLSGWQLERLNWWCMTSTADPRPAAAASTTTGGL